VYLVQAKDKISRHKLPNWTTSLTIYTVTDYTSFWQQKCI